MPDNRQTRAKKNILASLLCQMVVLVCGIIVPRLMLEAFGSEAYGATASIAQFLSYITLLEGGVGSVAKAALYKPLAQKDMATISAIMEELRRLFRIIGWIFAGYAIILACCFQTVSQLACMDWISTFMLVIVISVSTFGQYFIGLSYSILLRADQKTYITNLLSIGTAVLNAIFTIVLVKLGCSLIIVKLATSSIFFMGPIILSLYVKKYYALSKQQAGDKEAYLTQKWTGLGQHIAFFLHSNTDIAVLTILADLRAVAVYSVYNMIISHLQSLAISFCSGIESVFGDMLARNEKKQLHVAFRTYETILSIVSIILFSVATVLIIPFIKLYTSGISDADYIRPLFALVMILTALSYCLRLPYHAMIIAAGHFRQTSLAAYGEVAVNIVLSVILVLKYDLLGVALATLLATWFRFIYYVFYLSKNIFDREIKLFLKRLLVNVAAFACNCIVGYRIISFFPMGNYLLWAACGALLVAALGTSTLALNMIFFKRDCCSIIKRVVKRP